MKFQNFSIGQVFVTDPILVTKEEIIEYAIKFDPHYYHLDEKKANESFFGNLVASGMHTISLLNAEWVKLGFLGDDMLGGLGIEVKWNAPVYPNEEIYTEISVANKKESPDGKSGLLILNCLCKKKDGETFATVRMKVIVAA